MKIFITTSDNYRYLVPCCVRYLEYYWPGNDITVLGFEPVDGFVGDFVSMGKQADFGKEWTTPVGKAIKKLAPDRFVMMLDDYFITHPVDAKVIESLERRPYSDAVKIDLSGDRANFPHRIMTMGGTPIGITKDNLLIESDQRARYRSSLQLAIWDKQYFMKLCRPHRTIWEFELVGEREAMNDGCQILGTQKALVRYRNVMLKGKNKGGPSTEPPSRC